MPYVSGLSIFFVSTSIANFRLKSIKNNPLCLVVDYLFQAFLLHLAGQLEIVHGFLKQIKITESSAHNINEDRLIDAQLIKCIEELQKITL